MSLVRIYIQSKHITEQHSCMTASLESRQQRGGAAVMKIYRVEVAEWWAHLTRKEKGGRWQKEMGRLLCEQKRGKKKQQNKVWETSKANGRNETKAGEGGRKRKGMEKSKTDDFEP